MMSIDKQTPVSMGRGFDSVWMVQLVVQLRRLIALAMWQDYRLMDPINQFVKTLDQIPVQISPKASNTVPISRLLTRALRYDTAAGAQEFVTLLRRNASQFHWHQNKNYSDPDFLQNYGYVELIGPDGYAVSDQARVGLLLLAADTLYPMHHHPAEELYFVLSGHARFQKDGQPWRNCPAGIFIHHPSDMPHAMQTKDQWCLALYLWRGDVTTPAVLR